MTEGLYFDVIVFFLEKSVNENWRETLIGWGNQDVWREPKLMNSPTKSEVGPSESSEDLRLKESMTLRSSTGVLSLACLIIL